MKTTFGTLKLSLLGGVVALTAPGSFAQQLEEVLVTARKRQENIQNVPMAITAISAQEIARAGLVRLQDISQLVPNMTYLETTTNRFTNLTLRGISSGGGLGTDPAIGLYIDEVYVGRDSAFNNDLLDIERVEVLQGPQGTLFGRNTTVGAINITTRRPGDELEGMVIADFGNYDYTRLGGLISVPLGEDFAGKLSLVQTQRDGYLDNSFGGTVNEVDLLSGRGQLLWTPTDRLDVLLTANYRESKGNGNDYVTRQVGEPLERTFDVSIPDPGFEDLEDQLYSLTVNWELGATRLTSITAYQSIDEAYRNDSDWTPLDDVTTNDLRDMESWSQELRLESVSDGPLEWVAGLFYYRQDFDVFTEVLSGGDTIYAFFGLNDLIGSGIPPSEVNPGLPNGTAINATSTIETESVAAFASASYRFSDRLSLSAGLRYSEDDKDLDYEQQSDPLAAAVGFVPFTLADDQNDSEWTPTVTLNFEPRENMLLYARYARGYKAGGFNNSVSSSVSLVSFDAETLDNYEVGLKATLFDNTLRLNAALFTMEYSDKQESRFISGVGFQQTNAGEATSSGFEADIEWVASAGLSFFGAVGYADAEYDEFVVDENTDNSGNKLTRAPEWTANAGVEAEWGLTNALEARLRVDVSYQDDFFFNPNNDPFFVGGDQTLVNARLAIGSTDSGWTATLWGRNLTDEDTVNNLFGATSFVFPLYHYALIAPRTYGLELQYSF